MNCYCGSHKNFTECCQPYHQGKSTPLSPEKLMRSRYSAFCDNQVPYLISTHWPVDPTASTAIQQTIDSTRWLGLKIIASTPVTEDDTEGFVEFVAFFEDQGIRQLHEKSRFEKQEGRWFYTSGETLPPLKLGRNDPCFCASGKKFKKCHGG